MFSNCQRLLFCLVENILIDEDQHLKLIDFGLCARPSGGMTQVLETCCGSPAYAAPELVTGQNYLGSEADIWSMGVLLYALLCGFLPFDDENISALYKKIQSGVYERPAWLSRGSVELLDRMLQTDPKRRITVEELLRHPWLMDGYDRPVRWQSKYHGGELDQAVVEAMAAHRLCSPKAVAGMLGQWDYTSTMTCTYLILLERKHKGQSLALAGSIGYGSPMREIDLNSVGTPKRVAIVANTLGDSPRGLHNSLEGGLDDSELLGMGKQSKQQQQQQQDTTPKLESSAAPFERSKNRASERYHIPNKKRQQAELEGDKENHHTPVRKNNPAASSMCNSPLSPSRSMDSGLNSSGHNNNPANVGTRTPSPRVAPATTTGSSQPRRGPWAASAAAAAAPTAPAAERPPARTYWAASSAGWTRCATC